MRSRGVREERTEHTILSLELSQDLVLPNVGQVDFYNFRKYWNYNVLEVALKTFRFAQGLRITHLLFFFDISKPC